MSTCAPTDRLLQTIKVHAPGVTDAVLTLELFNVMDEFYRRTSAWRYVNEITLLEGYLEYDLAVPAGAVVVRVMDVGHNGLPVPAASNAAGVSSSSLGQLAPEMTFPDGDATFEPDASDLAGGVFSYAIYRPDFLTVTVAPTYEQTQYPLIATLALSLEKGCLECDCGEWGIDEWQWDMFFQDWYDGVLARLYGMPAKPWSSPTLGVYHGRRFRNAMAYRKQEANRGYNYAVPARPMFPRGGWI